MKIETFSRVAVGVALAGVSLSALALSPSQVPVNNRVYIGGATATDAVLRDVFLASGFGLCDPAAAVDVYENGGSRAILCRARAGLGSQYNLIQGQPIGYVKEANGGSGNGTQPVANQTNLSFLDLDNSNFSCSTNTSVPAGSGLIAYNLRQNCTPNNFQRAPGAGIADVEARLLNATPAEQNRLSPTGLLDIVFGVPVSTALYRDLQAAQGLTPNDNCANAPSLTRSQVVGLYTGLLADGSQLVSNAHGDDGTELAGGQIYICRRGDTSGTQAGSESYWLRQRCEDNTVSFALPDDPACQGSGCNWSASYATHGVFAGSGSGAVRSCLDTHSKAGQYAVGILSTESNPFTGNQDYRWVRVDGAASTLEQTANSNYEFFTSNVLNRRAPNVLSNLQNQIVNYFVNNVGNPQFVAALNAPFQNGVCLNGFGDGGVMAVAGTAAPATFEAPYSGSEVRATPINSTSKQPVGEINNCQPPVIYGEQAAGGQFRPSVPTYAP